MEIPSYYFQAESNKACHVDESQWQTVQEQALSLAEVTYPASKHSAVRVKLAGR